MMPWNQTDIGNDPVLHEAAISCRSKAQSDYIPALHRRHSFIQIDKGMTYTYLCFSIFWGELKNNPMNISFHVVRVLSLEWIAILNLLFRFLER